MPRSRSESFKYAPPSPLMVEETLPAENMPGPWTLSPEQIDAPAFFVDEHLSIRWMAANGRDSLSMALAKELRIASSRNVFNILLRPSIKHAVADWQSFFSFVYKCLHRGSLPTMPPLTDISMRKMRNGEAENESVLRKNADDANHGFFVDSRTFGKDKSASKRLYCLTLDNGMLFVSRAAFTDKQSLSPITEIPAAPRQLSAVKSICVLSARLNRPHSQSKTMLPEHFLKMMDRIWEEADSIARSLGGKQITCNGPRICYGFVENAGRDPVFSAVCCAMRLNDQMRILEEKLSAQYGWANEILLNMGIGHGEDLLTDFGAISRLSTMMPDGAFEQASLLSKLADRGEIWISRNAAASLPADLMSRVVLGIDHENQFLEKCFKPLSEFVQIQNDIRLAPDMQDFPVARIKNLEHKLPEHLVINEE